MIRPRDYSDHEAHRSDETHLVFQLAALADSWGYALVGVPFLLYGQIFSMMCLAVNYARIKDNVQDSGKTNRKHRGVANSMETLPLLSMNQSGSRTM